jgi:hypothetical protein
MNHQENSLDNFLKLSRERSQAAEQKKQPPFAISFDELQPAADYLTVKSEEVPNDKLNWPSLELLIFSLRTNHEELLKLLPQEVVIFLRSFNLQPVDQITGKRAIKRKMLFTFIESLESARKKKPELFDYVLSTSLDKALERHAAVRPMTTSHFYIEGRLVPLRKGIGILTGAATWSLLSMRASHSSQEMRFTSVLHVPAADSPHLMDNLTELVTAMFSVSDLAVIETSALSEESLSILRKSGLFLGNERTLRLLAQQLNKPCIKRVALINWLAEDEKTYPVAVLLYKQYLKDAVELIKNETSFYRALFHRPEEIETLQLDCLEYLKSMIKEPKLKA